MDIEFKEQRTKNKEQRTKNKEQGAKNKVQECDLMFFANCPLLIG